MTSYLQCEWLFADLHWDTGTEDKVQGHRQAIEFLGADNGHGTTYYSATNGSAVPVSCKPSIRCPSMCKAFGTYHKREQQTRPEHNKTNSNCSLPALPLCNITGNTHCCILAWTQAKQRTAIKQPETTNNTNTAGRHDWGWHHSL